MDYQLLSQSEQKEDNFFSLIQKVGPGGTYQFIMAIGIIIQWFIIGAILLSPSLLFKQTQPLCPDYILKDCLQYVCSLDENLWHQYYPNKIDSLRYSFGHYFICQYQWIVTFMQSLIYVGNFFSNVGFGLCVDNIGRKPIMILAWGSSCLGLILITISWNIIVVGIGLFLLGLGIDQTCTVTFSFMTEQIQSVQRQRYCIMCNLAWPFGGLALTGIFSIMPHWRELVIYTLLVPALFSFLLIYFIQDNPRFRIRKGIDVALKSLGRIARINGMSENPVTSADIQKLIKRQQLMNQQRKNGTRITLKDLFRYKSLLIPCIFAGLIQFSINIIYFGPILIVDSIGISATTNQAILIGSQTFAYVATFFLVLIIPRRISGMFTFGTFVGLSIILIFIKDDTCDLCAKQYVELILMVIARFLLCIWYAVFMVYRIQLYPESARGIACGVGGGIGCVGSVVCVYLINIFENEGLNPMILFAIIGFLALGSLIPLKQTLNIKLREEIEELQHIFLVKSTPIKTVTNSTANNIVNKSNF